MTMTEKFIIDMTAFIIVPLAYIILLTSIIKRFLLSNKKPVLIKVHVDNGERRRYFRK